MVSSDRYTINQHIRYEVKSDQGQRVFIIPNIANIPDMTNVLCLYETSLIIWEMVDKYSCKEIIDEICLMYHREKEEVEHDVIVFLTDLVEKGYITINKRDEMKCDG